MVGKLLLGGALLQPVLSQARTAQTSSPDFSPSDKCFSVARTQAGETPNMPLLLNQCTGETWLLVYSDAHKRPYWVRIEFGQYLPSTDAPEPTLKPQSPVSSTDQLNQRQLGQSQ